MPEHTMEAIFVLTDDPVATMLKNGGSGYWVAVESRVRGQELFAAVSKSAPRRIFLVGRKLSTSPADGGRVLIRFAEYAEIDQPFEWPGGQNPVRYGELSLDDLGTAKLKWQKFPVGEVNELAGVAPLTVDQAKKGLAKSLGISPDKIEIVIRA